MHVLFVCLGNICRSPMAEAVLADLVARRSDAGAWRIDSAGTGDWHRGSQPDPRTLAVLRRHGMATAHRARQVARADFAAFTWILAMDRRNLADLEQLRPAGSTARLALLGDFDPLGVREVPDPYYDGDDAFTAVHAQVLRCLEAWLATNAP